MELVSEYLNYILLQCMEAYKNPVLLIAIIPTALWNVQKGPQGWASPHASSILLSAIQYPIYIAIMTILTRLLSYQFMIGKIALQPFQCGAIVFLYSAVGPKSKLLGWLYVIPFLVAVVIIGSILDISLRLMHETIGQNFHAQYESAVIAVTCLIYIGFDVLRVGILKVLKKNDRRDNMFRLTMAIVLLGAALGGFYVLPTIAALMWLVFLVVAYPIGLAFGIGESMDQKSLLELFRIGIGQIPVIGKMFSGITERDV